VRINGKPWTEGTVRDYKLLKKVDDSTFSRP
jgi:hypothetical protein